MAGPGWPGRGLWTYQPASPQPRGTSRAPEASSPRRTTCASTPIDGMRNRDGGDREPGARGGQEGGGEMLSRHAHGWNSGEGSAPSNSVRISPDTRLCSRARSRCAELRAMATATAPRPRPAPRRTQARRADPRPRPFNRMRPQRARRLATAMLALMGLLILVAISGVKFARQPLGYVGVVRNGGPLDNRDVRQILLPGSRIRFIGLFSQAPHQYPSVRSLRTYTVTADPKRGSRPGVDVVSVPTRDGVQIGLEATVYLRFVGEADPVVLKRFDSTVGTRKFPLPSGNELYPWEGADGFAAMLDGVFRPVLDNDLRREVGGFDCAEIVASCALVRPSKHGDAGGSALRTIEERIDASLSRDLVATIGQPYFRDLRFRLV